MDHHPRAVEICNLKMGPFLKPQTAGVDCRETGAVGGKPDQSENSANLIRAQDLLDEINSFVLRRTTHHFRDPAYTETCSKSPDRSKFLKTDPGT
jgi:hypothetical protein